MCEDICSKSRLPRGVEPEGLQMPSDEALTDILYAGMQTREVDFDMARAELASFLEGTIEQQQDLYEVEE